MHGNEIKIIYLERLYETKLYFDSSYDELGRIEFEFNSTRLKTSV